MFGTLVITYIDEKDKAGFQIYRDITNLVRDEAEQKKE